MQILKQTITVYDLLQERFGLDLPRERRSKETNQYLSTFGVQHKKAESRQETQKRYKNDEGYKAFVKWMDDIRRALGENDDDFAKRFGLKSGKMIARYRRCTGNLPTEATLKELFRLERITAVRIERG